MIREQKSFNFSIKTTDDELGQISGYLSVFGNVDEGKDRVLPGAFKRTLQNSEKRMTTGGKKFLFPVLWQHDQTQPIGGCFAASEDSTGLFVKFQLDLNTQKGREAYSGYKAGYMDQLSIGYDVVDSGYDAKGVRDLKELRLWEGSAVTFAMNTLATVNGVKSTSQMEAKEGRAISAATGAVLQTHIDRLKGHAQDLNNAADDLATFLQGSEAAYGTDPGDPENQPGKASSHSTNVLSKNLHSESQISTEEEQDYLVFLQGLGATHLV